MNLIFLVIGIVLGSLIETIFMYFIRSKNKGGTLIVKDGFQKGVIESFNLRFTIGEEEICGAKELYFDVIHEK